ncbi:ParB N-terminal domain-containing protein [Clostridium perfringens]|nr:ParB N-terminal domain-containing protein [Clostridium perfringens]
MESIKTKSFESVIENIDFKEINHLEDENINLKIKSLLLEISQNPNILKELAFAIKSDPDVKINSFIFASKAYDQFKTLPGNRKLNDGNLKKIKESIKKYGYKRSQPITLNENNEIINGQHRFKLCKELELPLYFNYERCNEDSLNVTVGMNISQKNWTLLDFVKSYADLGNQDYKNFLELIDSENISPSLILWLIYHSRNGYIQDIVKSGKLRCTIFDMQRVRKIVIAIKELREVIPTNLPKERKLRDAFLGDKIAVPLAIIMYQDNYNHNRMLKQITRCYNSIDKRNMSVAGETLVNIYNLRLKDPNSRLTSYEDMEASLKKMEDNLN